MSIFYEDILGKIKSIRNIEFFLIIIYDDTMRTVNVEQSYKLADNFN
ncbi:hypothetical protein SAMN04487893_101334 [Myroides guanonis]|uniref:Uncharacterized protein n=1 Tax=Myroides guanonis TaxID=1150112 RepID=A0A1I3LI97_9FLAO|nr:hypothetical protein SAMN04487893_101334 [Myroides guanonis]